MYYCAFVLVLGVTGVVLIVLDLSLTWGSGVWLSMTYESDICRLHIFCGWSGNSRQKRETKFGKKEQKLLCHNPLIGNLMHKVWMIRISMQLMGLGWQWSTTSWMVAFIFSVLIIIIKSEVWAIIHCLGLVHQTRVRAVCLYIRIVWISCCWINSLFGHNFYEAMSASSFLFGGILVMSLIVIIPLRPIMSLFSKIWTQPPLGTFTLCSPGSHAGASCVV